MHVFGNNWLVILLMLAAAFSMGMLLLTLNWIVAPRNPRKQKRPHTRVACRTSSGQPRYTPRFYVVAMLFVIFDIEAMFIFPWAVNFDHLGLRLCSMFSFIGLLFVGYVYAWKKGALEWV